MSHPVPDSFFSLTRKSIFGTTSFALSWEQMLLTNFGTLSLSVDITTGTPIFLSSEINLLSLKSRELLTDTTLPRKSRAANPVVVPGSMPTIRYFTVSYMSVEFMILSFNRNQEKGEYSLILGEIIQNWLHAVIYLVIRTFSQGLQS